MASHHVPPCVPIYHKIDSQLPPNYWSSDDPTTGVDRLLDEARNEYPHVANLTLRDYVKYWSNKANEEWENQKESMKFYSLTELWKFLYQTPLQNRQDADIWATFLNNSYFPAVIDLGKLDGKTTLRLAPGNFYFEHFSSVCPPEHEYVGTGVVAAKYGDRHAVKGAQYGSSDDGVLRQFKEVGCILADGMNGWDRTGHVLVIDMGEGRERHPWIILAREWEVDDGYLYHEVRAPQSVSKNENEALGVFPGYSDRTTIARLNAGDNSNMSTPLVLQFGPNLGLELDDRGTNDMTEMSKGPELARVMPWVRRRDRSDCQEICYSDDDGMEVYMRYDARDQKFSYGFKEQARLV
ncbi:MAG: hypothetical protein L6R42_007159 [Xanthoria sp. 1 TBL-2021]|nr:MAG: hypothetical protein L6R42_007159 [Xanthoria sp. 1 TBL-2021]